MPHMLVRSSRFRGPHARPSAHEGEPSIGTPQSTSGAPGETCAVPEEGLRSVEDVIPAPWGGLCDRYPGNPIGSGILRTARIQLTGISSWRTTSDWSYA